MRGGRARRRARTERLRRGISIGSVLRSSLSLPIYPHPTTPLVISEIVLSVCLCSPLPRSMIRSCFQHTPFPPRSSPPFPIPSHPALSCTCVFMTIRFQATSIFAGFYRSARRFCRRLMMSRRRPICSGWMAASKAAGVETTDVSSALGLLLSVKDDAEVEMVKRASILTNKVCVCAHAVESFPCVIRLGERSSCCAQGLKRSASLCRKYLLVGGRGSALSEMSLDPLLLPMKASLERKKGCSSRDP